MGFEHSFRISEIGSLCLMDIDVQEGRIAGSGRRWQNANPENHHSGGKTRNRTTSRATGSKASPATAARSPRRHERRRANKSSKEVGGRQNHQSAVVATRLCRATQARSSAFGRDFFRLRAAPIAQSGPTVHKHPVPLARQISDRLTRHSAPVPLVGHLPCSLDTYPSSYPTSPRAPNLGRLST